MSKQKNTGEKAKKATTKESAKKFDFSKLKKNKPLQYTVIGFSVVILLVLVSLIPVGSQSMASRSLDAVGFHKAAMGVDLLAKDKTLVTKLASLNHKDSDNCEKLWDIASQEAEGMSAISMKELVDVRLANPEYQDSFYFQGFLDLNINLEEEKMAATGEMAAKIDFEKIQSSFPQAFANDEEMKQVASLGETKVEIGVNTVATKDNVYVTVDKLNVQTEQISSNNALTNWYKVETNLTETQKEGVGDIIDIIQDLSKTQMDEIFSNSTGETLSKTLCKAIDEVEVNGIKSFTFGENDNKENIEAREIVVELKDDYQEVVMKEFVGAADKVINDRKLEEFAKSQYDNYVKLMEASEKITGNKETIINQEQFDKMMTGTFANMRDSFNEQDKSTMQQSLNSAFTSNTGYEPLIKQEIQPMKFYINSRTGEPLAYQMQYKIIFSEQYLSMMAAENAELKNMFKDGILITAEIYDIKYNEGVSSIQEPEDAKGMEELYNDFMSTDIVEKAAPTIQEYFNSSEDEYDEYGGLSADEYYDQYHGNNYDGDYDFDQEEYTWDDFDFEEYEIEGNQ